LDFLSRSVREGVEVIRVGVVGFGYASATIHAPLIGSTPGLLLAGVSSSRPEAVAAAGLDAPVSPTPQALFERPDIDLVVIATPNDTHHPLAAQALACGKHVVVDKPFTLSLAQAEDLVRRAVAANRLLTVFHNRRWDADFLTLRDLLAQGVLGRVVHVESRFERFRPAVRDRWREGPLPGAGLWYDLGPHLVDQALLLFGEPQRLVLDTARLRDGALADDWFHAVLQYPALRVVLQASVVAAEPGPRFVVHGLHGSFVKNGLDPQEEALKRGERPGGAGWGADPAPGRLTRQVPEGLAVESWPGLAGDYGRFYAGVRDALQGRAPMPVPPEEAVGVMRWLEAGLRGAGSGVPASRAPG
jgi:predicted dehydrogenase